MDSQVPRFAASLKAFGIAAAIVTIAEGGVVELGWLLDIPVLKGVLPDLVPMQPVTGMVFMVLGVSLLLALKADENIFLRRLHKALAAIVVCVGILTVLEYAFYGQFLRGDRQLLMDNAAPIPPLPGRPSLGAAMNFVLLGVALLLRGIKPLGLVVTFTAVATFAMSLVALYGYILGVPSLYSVLFYSSMALNSTLLFLLLSMASLFNNPYGWVVRTIFTDGAGRLSRSLLPFALLGPALLAYLFGLGVKQGLYEADFGRALQALTMAVTFSLLILFLAFRSNTLETLRRSKEELEKSHERLQNMAKSLVQANLHLEMLSTTDPLTELPNRRVFNYRLEEELARSHRYELPLSVLMLDVDNFKSYNDSFGHPAGDEVLKTIAYLLVQKVREVDCVARLGGEEFGVVMPETHKAQALAMAERLRHAVACATWPRRKVTVSIGVASLSRAANHAEAVIAEADAALYEAKRSGRNRVEGARPRRGMMGIHRAAG